MGMEVAYLFNMANTTGRLSRSHGLPSYLIEEQARSMGLTLIQRRAGWNTYEREFKKAINKLKKNGVVGGIFGDIDLEEHRAWVERICQETNIKSLLPLWHKSRERLLNQFIAHGFRAIIVTVKSCLLGEEWLGRQIDEQFIKDIRKIGAIDICGEQGEYHTFVYDGPFFRKPVRFTFGKRVLRKGYCFLELKKPDMKRFR